MTLSEAAKILNVSESATPEQVYKAYKRLAKKYHPDLNNESVEAKEKMQEINAAYAFFEKYFQKQQGNNRTQNQGQQTRTHTQNQSRSNRTNTNDFENNFLDRLWEDYKNAQKEADDFIKNDTIPKYQELRKKEEELNEARAKYQNSSDINDVLYLHKLDMAYKTAEITHKMSLANGHTKKRIAEIKLNLFEQAKQAYDKSRTDF